MARNRLRPLANSLPSCMFNLPIFGLLLAVLWTRVWQQLPASPAVLPATTRSATVLTSTSSAALLVASDRCLHYASDLRAISNDQGQQSQRRQEGQPSLRPQAFSKYYCGPKFNINSHFKLGSGSLSPSRWRLHLRSQLCLPGVPSRGRQCPPLGLPRVNFKCFQVSFKSLHHRPVRRQVKCSMGPQSRRWLVGKKVYFG